MIVFSKNGKKNRLRFYAFLGKKAPPGRRQFILRMAVILLFICSIGITSMISQWMYRYGYQGPHQAAVEIKQFVLKVVHFPNYFRAMMHPLPHIQVDMKFKDYDKLVSIREQSIKRGDILKTGNDFVPCTVESEDQTVSAQARFKGNALDNISGDKWALRFKVSGTEPILGAREFSLHPPDTIDEWTYPFFLFAMKREGIAVPRFKFVTYTLNGVDQGVFGWEEEMRPELIEFNQRREGIILGYDESLAWENWKDSVARNSSPFINWQNTAIQIFGEQKTKKVPSLGAQANVAVDLMEKFRNGKMKASEVFDVPLLTRYLALNSLLGGGHSSLFRNIRLLYNPISSKLEPIARDGSEVNGTNTIDYLMAEEGSMYMTGALYPTQPITTLVSSKLGTIHRAWFSDPIVLEAYIRELQRVSTDEYIEQLIKEAASLNETNLFAFRRYKAGTELDFSHLRQNQKTIRNVLNPAECLQAKAQLFGSKLVVSVANLLTLPVEIDGFRINGKEIPPQSIDSPISLPGKAPTDVMAFKTFTFENIQASSNGDPFKVEIAHHLIGVPTSRTLKAKWSSAPFEPSETASVEPTSGNQSEKSAKSTQELLLEEALSNPYLVKSETNHELTIKPGNWNISKNLVLPDGYSLRVQPSTSLYFQTNCYILVTGPVHFEGEPTHPILFSSQGDRWQGILVRNARENSTLKHVIFERTSAPKIAGLSITGGVTFYQSDVNIQNCLFRDSLGEDSLNCVRSKVVIDQCTFENSYSDTFDTDFSEVIISNSSFSEMGDDALDLSTTKLTAKNVHIEEGRDKGFSLGEGSTQDEITNSFVKHMKTGVACKDGSQARISSMQLVSNMVGVAVYVHKQHFGAATLDAANLSIIDCDTPTQIETKSIFNLDGKPQIPNAEKVWDDFQKLGKKVKK